MDNQDQPLLQPQQYQVYQLTPNNAQMVACQTSKYRLQGSLFTTISDKFPTELNGILAPQDFSFVVRDINDAAGYKKGLRTTLLITLILSSVLFFFVFVPFVFVYVILLPVSLVLMSLSFIGLFLIQKTLIKRVQVVVDNFNQNFSNSGISMEFSSKRTKHINIIYPIYFNVQPMQNIQPLQQQQIYIKTNANENSSLLV
ncbi:hypothetical protein ACTA71_011672 [Dictyostelium dimigraforme]